MQPMHHGSDLLAFLTHGQGARIQRVEAPKIRAEGRDSPDLAPNNRPQEQAGENTGRTRCSPGALAPWRLGDVHEKA